MIVWLFVNKENELIFCGGKEPFLDAKDDETVWVGDPDFVFHLNQSLMDSQKILMELCRLKKSGDKIKLVLKKWPIE